MGCEIPCDRCIKTESKVEDASVYVVVVMRGDCPIEIQVSLAFPKFASITDERRLRAEFAKISGLANEWLSGGLPVSGLIRFFTAPPCKYSGIVGEALIAAMEVDA